MHDKRKKAKELIRMDAKKDGCENFEASMARLETIVGRLESAELPLDEMVALYEEGMALVKGCGARLDEAEMRILMISGKDGVIEKKDVTREICG